ncbi:hypothetical protein BH11PSE5_BH11PSE5_32480 [soil metagenome]|uniref:hypothetical protein n=1 Tax=Sphingobium sp. CECT 9361 TaxID=2845384 RepID=UPI001E284A8B|nr:hypothetical protein [Sphingobium sp. CECT 9361]CAH0351109.1 hypothetical protein SPH9361_01441 [Sphingobium sp. CECT 9361]
MAKADRLERLDTRREELEAEYRETLIAALEKTAGGSWGLFDHRQDKAARAAITPVIETLDEIGQTVDSMREQLGMAPFTLHRDFMADRGPVKSSAVGEPKQAQAWLEKLKASGKYDG